ncbi:MAG TPA: GNAT family N-acetyltransferase [Solirubrobacteraceae bacterium]|nr:GNAT family N-acetyltransferase [Solirubrobacteraceae bacterium]
MNLTLEDGLAIEIRPIEPGDKPLLVAGLRLLSPETQYKRFLSPKPSFSRSELRYLTEVDGHDHVALIAVEAENPSHPVGVARFVRERERPDTAEFAIVVGDAYQGRGAGRALARALVAEAQKHGVRRFTATTLADNAPIQRLIASIAQDLEHVIAGSGTRFIEAELVAA